MSTQVICDQCKKPITDIAYVVESRDVRDVLRQPITRSYIHWACLHLYAAIVDAPIFEDEKL